MRERPRILITEHAEGRAEGVSELVEEAGAQAKVVRLFQKIDGLDSYEYDAVIATGGPMGIYEMDKPEYQFLKKEADYLSAMIAKNRAVLGICLGHQLLAHVLGGQIEFSPQNAEVGWTEIILNNDGEKDLLFLNMPDEFWSFEYHSDRVVSPPPGTLNLASSKHCDVQAFRKPNSLIWGVQFHPEISSEKAKRILEARREALEQRGIDVMLAVNQGFSVSHEPRKQIFVNFVNALK